jgi:hypothetical protein
MNSQIGSFVELVRSGLGDPRMRHVTRRWGSLMAVIDASSCTCPPDLKKMLERDANREFNDRPIS